MLYPFSSFVLLIKLPTNLNTNVYNKAIFNKDFYISSQTHSLYTWIFYLIEIRVIKDWAFKF